MDAILGEGNNLLDYLLVLLTYIGIYIVMRQTAPRIERDFIKSYLILAGVGSVTAFVGNYVLYLLGFMSFLPWLNNFIHAFLWIGLALPFLYAVSHRRPLWEQFVLFAIYSFVIKLAENKILGTWEMDRFFSIEGNVAYLMGWSLFDAAYPVGALVMLWVASRFTSGVVVPRVNLLRPTG
jgi:hypothetical protein